MTISKPKKTERTRVRLEPGMSVTEFTDYYWLKADLTRFARQLGLPSDGDKPELSARIERRLLEDLLPILLVFSLHWGLSSTYR